MTNATTDPAAPNADSGAACVRYTPIRYLPRVNRPAVTRAPNHTSFQAISASGRYLKIRANRTVMTRNVTAKLATNSRVGTPGISPAMYFPAAWRAVVTTRET